MNKIAFIRLAHKDYNSEISNSIGQKALDSLKIPDRKIFTNEEAIVETIKAREFSNSVCKNDVDCAIIFFETWVEPSVAMSIIQQLRHIPIALWGFPMFKHEGLLEQTGSFVGLTVFSAALKRLNIDHAYIYGEPNDGKVVKKINSFISLNETINRLKQTRLGLVGYSAMSIYSGTFDHLLLRGLIGPEIVQIDTYSLIKIAEEAGVDEYRIFLKKIKKYSQISKDVKDEYLEKEGRLYFAIKKIIDVYKLDSINIKCQYELSQEYGCIPCPALSLIAEEGIVSGCEGDVLTTVSQVILHYLTGQVITYGDILDLRNKKAIFSACGFAPFSLAEDKEKTMIRDIATPGFKGPISSLVLKKGLVTYMRLSEERGNYVMSFGTAQAIDSELRQGRFPALWFMINGSEEKFLEAMHAQHFALCYGDFTRELIEISKQLKINFSLVD